MNFNNLKEAEKSLREQKKINKEVYEKELLVDKTANLFNNKIDILLKKLSQAIDIVKK